MLKKILWITGGVWLMLSSASAWAAGQGVQISHDSPPQKEAMVSAKPSSMTQLYGRVQVGLRYQSRADQSRLDWDPTPNSLVGIQGQTLLGQGVSVMFQVEHQFAISRHTALSHFHNLAYLGVQNEAWGQMSIGHHPYVSQGVMQSYDPFMQTSIGFARQLDTGLNAPTSGSFRYQTPRINGLQIAWLWAGQTRVNGHQQRLIRSIGADYQARRWSVAVAYDENHNAQSHHVYAGVGVYWPRVKLAVVYAQGRSPQQQKQTAWLASTVVSFSSQQALAMSYQTGYNPVVAHKVQQVNLGYHYQLSPTCQYFAVSNYQFKPHQFTVLTGLDLVF